MTWYFNISYVYLSNKDIEKDENKLPGTFSYLQQNLLRFSIMFPNIWILIHSSWFFNNENNLRQPRNKCKPNIYLDKGHGMGYCYIRRFPIKTWFNFTTTNPTKSTWLQATSPQPNDVLDLSSRLLGNHIIWNRIHAVFLWSTGYVALLLSLDWYFCVLKS